MAKPLPSHLDSSECAVNVDGATYYPHEGEWVELYRIASVGELRTLEKLRRLGVDMAAAEGEPDQQERQMMLINRHFAEVCGFLSQRVVAWNWTDLSGEPLPMPHGNPEALARLTADELMWLVTASQGETPGERKNASAPSASGSSATT